MRKLVLSFVLLFGIFIGLSFTENLVEAAEPTNTTKIDYTYQFNIDGVEGETTTISDVNYGTIINVDSGSFPQSGKTYVGYLENDKVSPTMNTSDTIRATDNTDITLIYKTSGTNAVIFMDANQDFINVLFTDGENHVNSANVPNHSSYTKPGLTVQGWTQNGSDVISDWTTTEFSSDTIVYLKYSDPATADLTLTVTNGSGGGSFKFNETVTVDTTGSTGTTFNYWLKDGEIASYSESYTFTMVTNHTLEAVYDGVGFTPHSGNFVYVSESYVLQDNYISILSQFDLDSGEELVEWGIVYSSTEATPTLATSNTTIKYSNKYNASTNEFVMSFADSISTVYYRAFVTSIDSSDNITTDYSSVIVNNVNSMMYTHYGTYEGQDLYLHYRVMSGTTVVQDWTFTAASYGLGSTPDGKNYNWSIELEVPAGTEIEWKFLVRQDGQSDIWMGSTDRTLPAGKNQFSSWDDVNNEYWFINEG
jgi:hypothetical protein